MKLFRARIVHRLKRKVQVAFKQLVLNEYYLVGFDVIKNLSFSRDHWSALPPLLELGLGPPLIPSTRRVLNQDLLDRYYPAEDFS